MDALLPFELKHIRGIPYYVQNSNVFLFKLSRTEPGKPSSDTIAIGTYDTSTDSIAYFANWKEHVEPHLNAFREELEPVERNTIRQTLVKPQKSRKPARNPRKGVCRTKATKNK